jgi:hypothetical protein
MALIEGGRVSDAAWQKVIAGLLAVIAVLAGLTLSLVTFGGSRALDRLEAVSDAVIRHEAEITSLRRDLELVRSGKSRSDLFLTGPTRLSVRGRSAGTPKGDVPRPPSGPPDPPDGSPEPKPKPQPRQERPADADDNRRDKILPVQE